jgi:hypothetical protein
LKLVMMRNRMAARPIACGALLQAVTEAETMVPTVVALSSGLAPEPTRSSLDLGAAIAHCLATLAGQGPPTAYP